MHSQYENENISAKVTLYVSLHNEISNLQHGAESCFEVYSVKFEERLIVTHKHGFGGGNGCWCFTTANILDSRHCRLCSVVKSRRTFEVSLSLSENFLNLPAYSRAELIVNTTSLQWSVLILQSNIEKKKVFLLLYIPVFLWRAGYLYDHVYISIWLLECVCISLYAIYLQGCQLSRIIRETPDFEPFLPVSRLEAEISRIIAEVCSFL